MKNEINKWRNIAGTKQKSCYKVVEHIYWNLNTEQNNSEKSNGDE